MFLMKNMAMQYKCVCLLSLLLLLLCSHVKSILPSFCLSWNVFSFPTILNYLWNLLDYTVYLVLFT